MLRVVEVSVPAEDADALRALLEDQDLLGNWQQEISDHLLLTRLLLRTEQAEPLLDLLQQRFGYREQFRAVLIRVHATVPEVPEPEKPPPEAKQPEEPPPQRVARAEIRNEFESGIKISRVYLGTVALSSIIAATGLIKANVAVIIGAMVVAPLLTPNMALAFAVTVGDLELARKAWRSAAIGMGIALGLSLLIGAAVPYELLANNPEVLSRTNPDWSDLILALASGSAGALAFTSGVSASLVGVMVAVALLPPLVVGGLMAANGQWLSSAEALLLLAINAICVILAAVGTFVWRGVSPRTWWEKNKAKRYTRRMIAICVTLALILLALVFVVPKDLD